MSVKTQKIILWRHEPYYTSPAHKLAHLEWEGKLVKATLYLDVDPYAPGWPLMGGCINRIKVNDREVSFTGDPCDKVSADITGYIKKGDNEIAFEFNENPMAKIGIQSGGCYGYIELETKPPKKPPTIKPPTIFPPTPMPPPKLEKRRIILWDHEPYYKSPATRPVQLEWSGELRKAILYLDVDPYAPGWPLMGGCINKILVNGREVKFSGDRCDKVSANIKGYLKKGDNEIAFEHNENPAWRLGIQSGGVYGYIDLEILGKLEKAEVKKPPPWRPPILPPPELKVSVSAPFRADQGEPVPIRLSIEGGVKPYTLIELDFGDGSHPKTWRNTSKPPTEASHIYKTAGTYTITLTVTDSQGNSKRAQTTITIERVVVPPLDVVLSARPTSGYAHLKVVFKVRISGGKPPYSVTLDYGDGSSPDRMPEVTSRTVTFQHVYDSPGTFTAVAEVEDSIGNHVKSSQRIVVLKPALPKPLILKLTAFPTKGTAPLTVKFNLSWSGGTPPYTVLIDYGDGTGYREIDAGERTSYTATYTYSSPGAYRVSAEVSDSSKPSKQTALDSVEITVQAKVAPPPVKVAPPPVKPLPKKLPEFLKYVALAVGGGAVLGGVGAVIAALKKKRKRR